MLHADGPPLDPTADEARQWLSDELAQSAYEDSPSLVSRFFRWLAEQIGRLIGGSEGLGVTGSVLRFAILLVVIALVVLVVIGILRGFRPEGRLRGGRVSRKGVLEGDDRSAAEHRADAERALAEGQWNAAVVAGFRAIARAAIERTVLDDLPGRTAHEVSEGLAPAFPGQAAALRAAANTFDDVFYGDRRAGEQQARAVVAADMAMASARPDFDAVRAPAEQTVGGVRR